MKKTSDEELNLWRYQDKRAPVSFSFLGDMNLCYRYLGDAKNLLWSVKNALSLNKQMQGEGERRFPDGTQIRVKCVYGIDYVQIDTTVRVAEAVVPSCTITLITFPAQVAPMRNLVADYGIGTIDPGEVAGIDYWKTYYLVTLENCPNCSDISWDLTFKFDMPAEPLHFHNDATIPQMGVPAGGDDPSNHMVYSGSFPAKAEIISSGQDQAGTYIIWKAYTESPLQGESYPRNGLAIFLITGKILNGTDILCTQNQEIKVDCCLKDAAHRPVEIWWEDWGTCQPFIMHPGVLYNAICLAPKTMPMGGSHGLIWYACTHPYQPFYSIPEIKGTCLPVTWKLTGVTFLGYDRTHDNSIYLNCAGATCHTHASITLTDRCGGTYVIQVRSCCEECDPLEVKGFPGMGCGQQQQFSASGGCGPYKFTCSNGSITEDGLYTAPATNPDCGNATITVEDCCGNTADFAVSLNCYADGMALQEVRFVLCDVVVNPNPPPDVYYYGLIEVEYWDCSGQSLGIGCYTAAGTQGPCPNCYSGPCDCSKYEDPPGGYHCTHGEQAFQCGHCQCGSQDLRSQAMKDQGCCPPGH